MGLKLFCFCFFLFLFCDTFKDFLRFSDVLSFQAFSMGSSLIRVDFLNVSLSFSSPKAQPLFKGSLCRRTRPRPCAVKKAPKIPLRTLHRKRSSCSVGSSLEGFCIVFLPSFDML